MQRLRSIRTVSVVTLVVAGVIAAVAIIAGPAFAASKPPIVKKYIRYGDGRKQQTIGYNKRHYRQATYKLKPRAIVLHHTAGADWRSAWNTFNSNAAYGGEKPGVSAQFIIHKNGTIYQCMPLSYRARHCVGMNWKSIGIEFVQEPRAGKGGRWMDRQILKRPKQIRAGLRLVRWLKARYGIKNADIVGHATANRSRFFRDYTGIKNAAGDWYAPEVRVFRSRL
ncbi:MAG: N-acetylmuramoyl-L-alanine amidase [Actinobacteria bacterium]|nr:N-acetylmuramoyl-L-alanine amidase [Actinomycetota bacterium]